jgi:hypothetical protein
MNGLQGSCFTNDSQIVRLHAERHEATSTQPAGISVRVEAA